MPNMGMQMGLQGTGTYTKRQFRWMFTIENVVGDLSSTGSLNCLPPEKSARPNLSFKEMNVQHLNEEVFYPAKPDWKPITIVAFDLQKSTHPVWNWLISLYDPRQGTFLAPNQVPCSNQNESCSGFIRQCKLELYNGCGNLVEQWIYEDCWPQSVNFQTLDMTQNGLVMCEITLRYVRAYISESVGC
jgi:hypothetical protein